MHPVARLEGLVEADVLEGPVAQGLVKRGSELDCRLVIIGARQGSWPSEWLLGGVAERFVAASDRPLLAVHQDAVHAYRRVLVAIDLGEGGRNALAALSRLDLVANWRVRIVHAYDVPFKYIFELAESMAPGGVSAIQRARTYAHADVSAFLSGLGFAELKTTAFVEEGNAYPVIHNAVQRWSADLLVLGSDGKTSIVDQILGSTISEALASCPCDVMIVGRQPSAPMASAEH
jgi:nucleotide-binding universal stress UspA family protein